MKKALILLTLVSSFALSACDFTFFEYTPGDAEQENDSTNEEITEETVEEREPITLSLQDPEFSFIEGDSEFIQALNIIVEDAYLSYSEYLAEDQIQPANEMFSVELDEANYYASLSAPWDGNMTATLFINESGSNYFAIDKRGCGPLCEQSVVFFTLEDGTLTEYMDVPFLDPAEQIELMGQMSATLEQWDSAEPYIAPLYTLPKDGTSITLADQYDSMRGEGMQFGTILSLDYDHESGTFSVNPIYDFSSAYLCDNGNSYDNELAETWMKISPYSEYINVEGRDIYKFYNQGMQLSLPTDSSYTVYADDSGNLMFDEAAKSGCVNYGNILRPTLSIFEPDELFLGESDMVDAFMDFGTESFANFDAQVYVQEFVEDTNVTFFEFEYLENKLQAVSMSCGTSCPDIAVQDMSFLKELLNSISPLEQ